MKLGGIRPFDIGFNAFLTMGYEWGWDIYIYCQNLVNALMCRLAGNQVSSWHLKRY